LLHSSNAWVIVSVMAHIPTTEADDQKVFRIARELGISVEYAAVTCAGFELAFGDDGLRRAIFEIIDQLDDEAYKKGEPFGMILSYAVELGMDGIHVRRHSNEIPANQVVSLTPTDRAMIFLRIKDNFPTQLFLGPLIVNRPDTMSEPRAVATCFDSFEGCSVGQGDSEITESDFPTELPSEWTKSEAVICLGPIRHTFNERFPSVSAAVSQFQRSRATSFLSSADCTALNSPHHPPRWAALPAGMPAFQSSGLSPPFTSENLGHSDRKMLLRPWQ
jgi:hypothetical protein